MTSTRWKSLERDVAQALGGERYQRDVLAFERAPDVVVKDLGLVVECKAYRRHAHHRHIEQAQRYCHHGETPAVTTREPGKAIYITVPLVWLAGVVKGRE